MTDNNTDNINIDRAQIRNLVHQYRETDDHQEQRQIENRVLRETVWQSSLLSSETGPALSQEQLERVYAELPDDAKEAKRIVRSYFFQG